MDKIVAEGSLARGYVDEQVESQQLLDVLDTVVKGIGSGTLEKGWSPMSSRRATSAVCAGATLGCNFGRISRRVDVWSVEGSEASEETKISICVSATPKDPSNARSFKFSLRSW